ncbi:hypothetical protein SCORR_v1c04700 [Spiroplasma corruscae]|uniref:Uncharacterized protein n=1 Tax=Spiroplasma corruscae TaxID=216934 RepID=A0A222EP38_9MOLU|nr:hypothetical protein [Spiroplasma corruscae]ASP28242.1 hypothetical protein SCORR_v1c04700 [Spiroplasma corruscae]
MFKALLKNPKRVARNLIIISIAWLLGAVVLALLFFYVNVPVPVWAASLISIGGEFLIMFFVIAILGFLANKRDAELRRRFMNETQYNQSNKFAQANGIDVASTDRNVKDIKKEMKALSSELYHAQERDKNLKLAKKF